MTISETYEFLNSIRRIEAAIIKMQIQRDELRACLLPAGIRYDKDKVQTSPADHMSQIEAKVVDMDREIGRMQEKKAETIEGVSGAIARLEDDNEQIVLLSLYVARHSAAKTARRLHYSRRGIYKLRDRAVKHLSEKLCTKCTPGE